MIKTACLYLTIILNFIVIGSAAQTNSVLKTTIATINEARNKLPIEKIYLQTDKPYYIIGDTLHFKAWLLTGDFLTPSTRSGLLYIELDDVNGKAVKRIMTPVAPGLAWNDIALTDKDFQQGLYTLRAYTNWMRNFGEDYIFKKDIYISTLNNATIVSAAFKLDSVDNKNKVAASLHFATLNKNNLRLKEMQLQVLNGQHTMVANKLTTDMNGSIVMDFNVADKTYLNKLVIKARQTGKGADTTTLTIPVTINRPETTDLQFMPEGGNLVAGINTNVGLKAIGEDGKATTLSGNIYNSKLKVVAAFKTTHAGMGSFNFTPQAHETYFAKAILPGGTIKSYALPLVNLTGTVLNAINKGPDSLTFSLSASANLINNKEVYYLIAQSHNVVCYAQTLSFTNNKPIKKTIASSLFPTGIVRLTLLNSAHQPLNERQIFINHNDELQININTDKQSYAIRDSITLNIEVKDKYGKPVRGSFALAVTDDSQVKTDSLGSNILNNMLLTSDLKGDIENPGYYFTSNNKTDTDLDNLMLTQGWIGYNWKNIFDNQQHKPQYIAEPEFVVQGKVTNIFNKPNEGAKVVLYARNPTIIRDTVTDKSGIFVFKGLFPVDTAIYKLSSHNKKGRDNVSIEMLNEFKPPVFKPANQIQIPWYVNSDTVLLANNSTRLAQLKAEANLRGEGHQLKEVVIKEKKIIKESNNLNGPGEADQAWDERDMEKANKMTLSEYLEKKVKGFSVFGLWSLWMSINGTKKIYSISYNYTMYGKRIKFIIDGVDIEAVRSGFNRYQYIRSILDFFTAEDITGIELMFNNKHLFQYSDKFVEFGDDNKYNYAYLEITTRAKQGPFMKKAPGTYLYKPLPFTLAKQFYSPKYTFQNKTTAIGTDLRSTLYWEPNVVTNADGKASIVFFSADKNANYNIIMEGTDLNGNLGYKTQTIKNQLK